MSKYAPILALMVIGACERPNRPPPPVLSTIEGRLVILYDKDSNVYQCGAPLQGKVVCVHLAPVVVSPDAGPLPAEAP